MGIVYTKLRSRLKAAKVHKIVVVRMDMKHMQREMGDEERSRKRKLDTSTYEACFTVPTLDGDPTETTTFRTGTGSMPTAPISAHPPATPAALKDAGDSSDDEDSSDEDKSREFSALAAFLIADSELDETSDPASATEPPLTATSSDSTPSHTPSLMPDTDSALDSNNAI